MAYIRTFVAVGILVVSQVSFGSSFGDKLKAAAKAALDAQATGAEGVSPSSAGKFSLKDGIVTDAATGLMWTACPLKEDQSSINCATGDVDYYKADWWDAALAVKRLNYGGFKDWRLPTAAELGAIHICTNEPSDYYSAQNPNPAPEFIDVATTQGTVRIRNVCRQTQNTPYLNSSVFVFDQHGFNDDLWTSTPSQDLKAEDWAGYPAKETFWATRSGEFKVAPGADKSLAKKKVIAVRGGSYEEFNAMIAKATAVQNTLMAAERTVAAERQQATAQQAAADQAAKKKLAAFRNGLKVGDSFLTDGGIGLALEIKGNLIRAQISLTGCAVQYADHSCAQWQNDTVERWVTRDRIFPRYGSASSR